jgi:hypothetical protein
MPNDWERSFYNEDNRDSFSTLKKLFKALEDCPHRAKFDTHVYRKTLKF